MKKLKYCLRHVGNNNMSKKTEKNLAKVGVIMLVIIVKTIKGKLGFGLNSADGTFLFKSKAIFTSITANVGSFYTPAFSMLALLNTQNTDFEKAIGNMSQGVLGAEGAKTEAKLVLWKTLGFALNYINGIALLNQANAIEIITGANMVVINRNGFKKQDFSVNQGNGTGEIKLASLAVIVNSKRVQASYEWQESTDNGVTWIYLPTTTVSRTEVMGVPVGIKVLFRKRTISVKGGTSAWSTPIGITPV